MKISIQNVLVISAFAFSSSVHAGGPTPVQGWNVDCNNHCSFSEFNNNCQGVYYYYPDGTRSYSGWSSNYNACMETAPLQANMHIITPNLIQCGCPSPTSYPPSETTALSNNTRAQLEVLRAQIQSWSVCTPDPAGTFSNLWEPLSFRNLNTCQYFRKRNLNHTYFTEAYKGLQGFEDTWHMGHFPGDGLSNSLLNCLFGDEEVCYGHKEAQNPATGQWYRNAFDRYHPETAYGQSLSSRDVLMGILAYVVAKNDKEALRKYMIAVRNNPKVMGFFNVCPARPNIPKPTQLTQEKWDAMLPDDRCMLIPEAAGQIYKVAKHVGFSDSEINAIGTDFFSALTSGSSTVFSSIGVSAGSAPAFGGPAYQILNVVDAIFIATASGGAGNSTLANAANTINNRTGKLNPAAHFLANNKNSTEYGAYLINKYCKSTRPQWGSWFTSGYSQDNNSTNYYNSGEAYTVGHYQYYGGWGPYGAKIVPSGHDCIAWLNMYLGNGDVREPKCDAGDTYINGACRKFAFTPPKLAAIAGIDYRLNRDNNTVDYMAIDLHKCPYGGTLTTINNKPRCAVASEGSGYSWNINYTVDPNETAPGIYYGKVNGACPYGGTYWGNNCLVKSYAQPILYQSIRYWVDTNPSWPGIYYAKINGACSMGGIPAGPNCMIHGFPSGFLSTSRTYFTRANPAYPGVFYYPSQVQVETKVVKVLPSSAVSIKNTALINSPDGGQPSPTPKKYLPLNSAVVLPTVAPTATPKPTVYPVSTPIVNSGKTVPIKFQGIQSR